MDKILKMVLNNIIISIIVFSSQLYVVGINLKFKYNICTEIDV